MGVDDGLVVDGGTDLFEEEVEEQACGQFADGVEIFFEVALDGGDGVGALLLRG